MRELFSFFVITSLLALIPFKQLVLKLLQASASSLQD